MTSLLAVGIDVGGTKIAAGLVDDAGTILRRHVTTAHAERPPAEVIAAIEESCAALVAQASQRERVVGVGVGFPGNINQERGEVLVSSNLPAWDHYPLRETLAGRLRLPVALDNDANMAALGEHRYGAGQGVSHLCYVTLSTGLGLGVVADGQVYSGAHGTAAELGHLSVDWDGPLLHLRQARLRHGVRERHRHLAHGLRGHRPRRRPGARRDAASRPAAHRGRDRGRRRRAR